MAKCIQLRALKTILKRLPPTVSHSREGTKHLKWTFKCSTELHTMNCQCPLLEQVCTAEDLAVYIEWYYTVQKWHSVEIVPISDVMFSVLELRFKLAWYKHSHLRISSLRYGQNLLYPFHILICPSWMICYQFIGLQLEKIKKYIPYMSRKLDLWDRNICFEKLH